MEMKQADAPTRRPLVYGSTSGHDTLSMNSEEEEAAVLTIAPAAAVDHDHIFALSCKFGFHKHACLATFACLVFPPLLLVDLFAGSFLPIRYVVARVLGQSRLLHVPQWRAFLFICWVPSWLAMASVGVGSCSIYCRDAGRVASRHTMTDLQYASCVFFFSAALLSSLSAIYSIGSYEASGTL